MSKEKDQILQIISNEAKSSIDQLKIVTPSVYASIFSEFAKEHDEELEDEGTYAKDLLNVACSELTNMQEETSKNVTKLSNNTQKAISAIITKDDAVLSQVLQETKDLRREIEKLKEAVYKDTLTHAFNRKWLKDNYLDNEDVFTQDGVLVMVDLNYFKLINDTHGHIIGDKVLVYVVNSLKKSHHTIIRYGGDEFIILFTKETTLASAHKLLDEIREDIITKKLKSAHGTFKVSFSHGGALFKKGDALTTVIEAADKNMYDDKVKIKERIKGI